MKHIASYPVNQIIAVRSDHLSSYEQSLVKDPNAFIEWNLTENSARDVLNYYIRCSHVLRVEVAPTRERTALDLGLTIKTVSRANAKLEELGLVQIIRHKIWRFKYRNEYKVSNVLLRPSVANKLYTIFSGLSYKVRYMAKNLSISLLFVNSLHANQNKLIPSEYVPSSNMYILDNHSLRRSNTTNCKSLYSHSKVDTHSRDAIAIYQEPNMITLKEILQHPLFKEATKVPIETNDQVISDKKRNAVQQASAMLKQRVAPILHLGVKGLISLTRYPDEALEYALSCLKRYGVRETRTNFELFDSACKEYCANNQINVDHQQNDALLRQLGYVDSQPLCKKLMLPEPLGTVIAPHTQSQELTTTEPLYTPPARFKRATPTTEQRSIDLSNSLFSKDIESFALNRGYSNLISTEKVDL
jgi:hypothetical protein